MKVQVTINNVKIIEPSILNKNEYNIHECEFEFVEEYNGLSKKAIFTNEAGADYIVSIVGDKCSIPSEVLKEKEFVKLGVYAYDVENEELVLRYSPRPTEFYVQEGSYKNAGGTPPTPSEIEQLQAQITHNRNDIEDIQDNIVEINEQQEIQDETIQNNTEAIGTINENIGDLQEEQVVQNRNIQANTDDIDDIQQEQTEQNTKIQKNTDNIGEINQDINGINEDIDNLKQDLTNYSLITETGSQINLNVNSTNYQITAILKDKNGNVIYTSNAIDLPIESMIVNARYDNATKEIVLTLQNGNTLRISVADLVSGLVSETQLQTILANYYNKTEVDNLLSNLAGRVSTNEEDIADIKEEQTTQNTNIEELQNQVETLQEDLDNAEAEIEELNTDITNMRKAMITVEGQGSDITLPNTSENKFVEFGLEGRTEQEQLKGVNLTEHDEITFPLSNDVLCDFGDGRTFSKLSFTLICNNNAFSYVGAAFILYVDENDTEKYLSLNTFQVPSSPANGTFTYSASNVTAKKIRLVNWAGMTGSIKLQIQEGEPTAWEPYTTGLATPNPNYIEPIKNVTGNANVKIQNKNLFDFDYILQHKNDFVKESQYFMFLKLDDSFKKQFTVSTILKGTSQNFVMGFSDTVFPAGGNDKRTLNNGTVVSPKTFDFTNATNVYVFFGNGSTISDDRHEIDAIYNNYNIQLEKGTTATSYVEHQEQNYPFTFAEGQRGMQGTQLLDDGIHQKRKQIVLDGTETFWNLTMDGDIPCFWFRNIDVEAKENPHNKKCNYFIYSSIGFKNAEINTLCENTESSPISLFIFKTNVANSIETWKQWLAQQYANGTPVIVEYELAESELENNIIPYNKTQQAEYDAIKEATSEDDIIIISSESDELGFNMNVVAVADANKVIGTRLETIESRLALLE